MDEDKKPKTEDKKPKTEDGLTPEGQGIEGETGTSGGTGTSGEEAHFIGEFDDLRDRLERIEGTLGAITETLGAITETLEAMRTTAAAIDIDNGANVVGAGGDGAAGIIADNDDEIEIPDYDDMDLDL